jgi:hypothetical protein
MFKDILHDFTCISMGDIWGPKDVEWDYTICRGC